MRRHLSLILSLFVVAGGATAAGIATASASTRAPQVLHASVKIAAGTGCTPAASYCFKPTTKTIASGTKVTWKNPTIAPHTVTRCDALHCSGLDGGTGTQSGFGSPTIVSGGKYSFTFTGAGTYNYYCSVHGFTLMHGTITVT